jgi:hypothetical protein
MWRTRSERAILATRRMAQSRKCACERGDSTSVVTSLGQYESAFYWAIRNCEVCPLHFVVSHSHLGASLVFDLRIHAWNYQPIS